ncbi:MAG: ATP synthase F1 subunit epsilon [Patescibacteria group bacterium]
MSQLHLKIVTPEKLIFDEEVNQVNVSTEDGQIGILPNHTNLMAKLEPGELVIKRGGKVETMAIGDGFLQMADNTLSIMTDLAVNEAQIDEKAVEEAKKRAEIALEQKLSDVEYAETLAVLEKSLAQLKIKRRHRVR